VFLFQLFGNVFHVSGFDCALTWLLQACFSVEKWSQAEFLTVDARVAAQKLNYPISPCKSVAEMRE
jgi:hypothetical protein